MCPSQLFYHCGPTSHALTSVTGNVQGYSTWNAFHDTISEGHVRTAADLLVSLGFKAAGYTYVNIDGEPFPAQHQISSGCLVRPLLHPAFNAVSAVFLTVIIMLVLC
jgi:sulfur carrier protein ThiS